MLHCFRLACLILSVAAAGLTSALADPAPPLPSEITLTNGAHLHHVRPVKWLSETVVLKHSGGVDPIRYENIAEPERAAFEAARDAALSMPAAERKKEADDSSEGVNLSGTVFVQTSGNGAQKEGDVLIMIFPSGTESAFETGGSKVHLPHPTAQIRTDADGRYSIKLPGKGPYFLYAQLSRIIGEHTEYHEWRISTADVPDPGHFNLANSNEYEWWLHGRNEVVVDD